MEQFLHGLSFINVAKWDHEFVVLLRMALIALAAWIGLGVTKRVIPMLRQRITRGMGDPEQVKRA